MCRALILGGIQKCDIPTFEDFLHAFSATGKLVYFSQSVPWELSKCGQGVGFSDSIGNKELIGIKLKAIAEHMPEAKVVLNIRDNDECNRPELRKTLHTLRDI